MTTVVKVMVGVVVGATLMWIAQRQSMLDSPEQSFTYSKAMFTARDQMACDAVASTMLFEDVQIGREKNKLGGVVKASASRGTDKLSLRVNRASKKLELLTRADVGFGRIDPSVMTLIRDDEDALIAVQVASVDDDVYLVRLDRKTGNAIWAKVGRMMLGGLVGWSHYLECR
jgi:hypothetical protein